MKVNIFYDGIDYKIKQSKKLKHLIGKVIREAGKIPGDLNFIITNDRKLRKINVEFLKRNYFTDVISFNNSENKIVNGEVYISKETVKRNALNYKVSLNSEMLRVMIHGTLHLCGYDDNTERKRNNMIKLEDKWIKKLC